MVSLGEEVSGINPGMFFAVCQTKVYFQDDIGNPKNIVGTGFWVELDGIHHFVTNKHNVDPTLKLGPDTRYKLCQVEIQLRRVYEQSWFPETSFVKLKVLDGSLRLHPTADVAVITAPSFDAAGFGYNFFSINEIATNDFLHNFVLPMDVASFIGYPGRKGKPWWDELWQMPIARSVNIASVPAIPFSNTEIITSDVSLVSGLSFSGSSGSPIMSHEKGIRVGNGLTGGTYVEPKLIGIMSGHWWGQESSADMFFHSGLSYFTRSTAILELLGAN